MNKLSEKDKKDIIETYINSNCLCVDLAKQYFVSKNSISVLLKKNGINIRKARHRKFHFYEKFFETIDSEDKAYFLGLMYADGNNSASNYNIRISLQERDFHILENFKKCLKFEKELTFIPAKSKNRQNMYLLLICSKKMSEDLSKLGCVPNKSLTLKFPIEKQLRSDLVRHFIRGYFDGDGGIDFYRNTMIAKICSTNQFCNSLKDFLAMNNIKSCVYFHGKNKVTSVLQIYTNKECKKFYEFIYGNASIFLNRKFEKFQSYYEYYREIINKRIIEFLGERKNLKEWSKDFRCKVSYSTLRHRYNVLKWDFYKAMSYKERKMK